MASSLLNQPPRKIHLGPPREIHFENEGDRISSLPDELLIHILTFLPTKDSFRTSILSTRWKDLWTLVPSLYFCLNNDGDDMKVALGYMKFIEMILRLHSSNVKKFYIDCPQRFDESRLFDWIDVLLKHNKVQDIDIGSYHQVAVALPISLFTCETLITLKLHRFLHIDVPALIYFHSLKVLDVSLESPSNELTERLFCSAPMLEELCINVFNHPGKSIYNISSPSLKKLLVSISVIDIVNSDCVVNVDAPTLVTLEVGDYCYAHYALKNTISLVEASVRINARRFHEYALENKSIIENLIMLLKSVSTVKNLYLSGCCPMVFFSSTYESKWPVFANMVQIELDFLDHYDYRSISWWPIFPNLKHLRLTLGEDFALKNFWNLLAWAPNLVSLSFGIKVSQNWLFMVNWLSDITLQIPSCLGSCLKEIEISEFDGLQFEFKLIRYLLENAQVVEKFTVKFSTELCRLEDNQHEVELCKSIIVKMPRCSKHCKFVFI